MDVIVNFSAGGKNGKKVKKALNIVEKRLKERKIEYNLHFTCYKGHGTVLTRELIENGATDIVIMGGDGSLHEVINGFSNFDKVNLGLIPCGTGNDFANALNLPKDPEKAIDLIIDGKPKYTDFMQLPTVRGMNVVGMGIDVDVLVKYSKLKHKNKFSYTWCLIKTLCKFDYTNFTATVDGKELKYRSFIAAIANGSMYGGGIPICPIADATDKNLNFLSVKEIKKSKILGALIKLLKGKILSLSQAEHTTCKKVIIQTEKPYVVNVDGELYPDIPFEVEIVSDTLKMYR
ncbi:MAG: diacylglycerol kinase family lipid kinase [Clostridia bacterium]|nr:diacylglycerol kinase family lipid kinase [Clostridia bacterium]